jgi:ParB-like chromosome segregation protein Spo0J
VEILTRPVVALVPYTRHLRKNDHAVQRMVASIQQFGFKIPVLVRSTGEIVDGDLRLKAAIQLGMTEIPVILCDEWSEVQVKAFRLLVNRSGNLGRLGSGAGGFGDRGVELTPFRSQSYGLRSA